MEMIQNLVPFRICTVKILKIDTIMITVIVVKVERYGFTLPECIQKSGDGIANSVDPDQTAL